MEAEPQGWRKLLQGHPWSKGDGGDPLPAYSEYMPAPLLGRKPLGEMDDPYFQADDLFGWKISEREEEVELRPGLAHVGLQIMNALVNLGKALPEHRLHGHGGQNLKDNPYWPPELAGRAGTLSQERYVALLPLMLSRTQDDKGRVAWTFFGNSIHDPEPTFWKSFYTAPGQDKPVQDAVAFFIRLINGAYGEKIEDEKSLFQSGFRILPAAKDFAGPGWTRTYLANDSDAFEGVKYLVTFRPFRFLPASVKELYGAGRLAILPFPGSLVFWGMPNYLNLRKALPVAGQIPLLTLASRSRGIGGLRVAQSGWLHEPHPAGIKPEMNEELVVNFFHRTHRWDRVPRHQDELNRNVEKVKIAQALFSTAAEAMGLYGKPMARNSQIWNDQFELILDGPKAGREQIRAVEEVILRGGLFGYRFFYPPMKVGVHDMYLHRPLVAFMAASSGRIEILPEALPGYVAGYHENDAEMSQPVELWPRVLRRDLHLSALQDFPDRHDHYAHQTSHNIHSLLDSWERLGARPLARSLAHKLLDLSKHKTLEQWLEELVLHSRSAEAGQRMKEALEKILEPQTPPAWPESLTYAETADRGFEEAWWNDIKALAHGRYVYKDNADITNDESTRSLAKKKIRDTELLGDFFLERHRKAIAAAGLEGIALCGELPFLWQTDFDFSLYGGWLGNQRGSHHERNILVVIPGKNRNQAVVFGDHYDTAFMEDIYDRGRGGSGARLAARGADDNASAGAALLRAAPLLLKLSAEGKLQRDVWLIHLTGEEFPADCLGARHFCRALREKNLRLELGPGRSADLSQTEIVGVLVMDMIGHNLDTDQDIFQISPGQGAASLRLARQAHLANMIWNSQALQWNRGPDRRHRGRGRRITGREAMPQPAKHLALDGEVRIPSNPRSSLFNTDAQIFSDAGVPVVLFMENYDISRSGYHDTKDTMPNIDLDYGSALAAIAIETVARVASLPSADESEKRPEPHGMPDFEKEG